MLEHDFADLQDKILKVCKDNKLEIDIKLSKFPVTATLRPSLEERDQLRFDMQEMDIETNFVGGEINLVFEEELTMTVLNDFRIEDSLLNRIKGMVKKLHYIFLQIYFKESKLKEANNDKSNSQNRRENNYRQRIK